jgi:hypothetical protein
VRGGKQSTAKIKLAKHDMPKMSFDLVQPGDISTPFNSVLGQNGFVFRSADPGVVVNPNDEANRILGMINGGVALPGMQRMNIVNPGEGERSINVTVNTGNSHVVLDDDQGSLDLTIAEGKKSLVAKDKSGKELFSGPIDTPEQRKALPEDVRGRLEKLEDSTQFSFKTGSDFKAETKVVKPRGQGISVPPQPAKPARPGQFF